MKTLILLRHGQSQWNKENRFTGWTDVPLSDEGMAEAANAATLLRDGGYTFDLAYTSVLKRAIKTLWIVLEQNDQMWIPVIRKLAPQRADVRRPAGARQGRDRRASRGRPGEGVAPELRRSPARPR